MWSFHKTPPTEGTILKSTLHKLINKKKEKKRSLKKTSLIRVQQIWFQEFKIMATCNKPVLSSYEQLYANEKKIYSSTPEWSLFVISLLLC